MHESGCNLAVIQGNLSNCVRSSLSIIQSVCIVFLNPRNRKKRQEKFGVKRTFKLFHFLVFSSASFTVGFNRIFVSPPIRNPHSLNYILFSILFSSHIRVESVHTYFCRVLLRSESRQANERVKRRGQKNKKTRSATKSEGRGRCYLR